MTSKARKIPCKIILVRFEDGSVSRYFRDGPYSITDIINASNLVGMNYRIYFQIEFSECD